MHKPGELIEKEHVDYIKSLSDKDFIESCFLIINKDRQEVPFIFNSVQNLIYSEMKDWNVICKARKLGVSVGIQAMQLTECLRRKNRNAVVLSFDRDATQRQLERTNWILNHLPFEVHLERESKNEVKILETNSKIFIGVAGSKAFGRGDDITNLHVQEYAYFENPEVLTGMMEALTPDAKVFVESTANGPTNDFAKLCRLAQSKSTRWKLHFFPWWIDKDLQRDVPKDFAHTEEEKEIKALYKLTDRQLSWRRYHIANMLQPELFPQEMPANLEESFLVLGDCIFDKRSLKVYESLVSQPNWIGELINVQ